MNFTWIPAEKDHPIVEFHDVRTEKAQSEHYLDLIDGLGGALAISGAHDLGQFRVAGHPDRLILLRGFASIPARRQALEAFHVTQDWSHQRANAASLVRNAEVILTRAVTPAAGIRALRGDEPITAIVSELRFAEQIGSYHLWLRLLLRKAGMDPIAAFATLEAVNDVPAVPVVKNRSQHIALIRSTGRVPSLPPELRNMLRYPPEILTLEPALTLVW